MLFCIACTCNDRFHLNALHQPQAAQARCINYREFPYCFAYYVHTQHVVIEVPDNTSDCAEPKTFKKRSHKKHFAIPMTREEIRDWPGLNLKTWRFHGESMRGSLMSERFVSLDCTQAPALLRFMKENNSEKKKEPQNRKKWPSIEASLHRNSTNRPKFTFYFYSYAYIYTF